MTTTQPSPEAPLSAPLWDREKPVGREWKPGLFLLGALRDYQKARNPFAKKWAVFRHRLWSAVSGADIPLNSQIGGGLLIPHPTGVVIHHDAKIAENVAIFQQATIGSGGPKPGAPTLHSGVLVGAGAKVLGGVVIGANAKIGANAVVLSDIPANCTAVGIPAKITR